MSSDFGFLDITRIQLQEAKRQVNLELDGNMEEYYNQLVIPEIKRISAAMGLPQGFINGFEFVKTGRNKGKIINTWGTEEKPLAKWFNYGTKDKIWIQPKDPDGVLAWPSGGPSSGRATAIYSKNSAAQKGQTLFSKGHYISGQPETKAMERGVKISETALISQVSMKIMEKFKQQ